MTSRLHRIPIDSFKRILPLVALLGIAPTLPGCSPEEEPLVQTELSVFQDTSETGTTVQIHVSLRKGWHSYWENPGESGLGPTLSWKTPPGTSIGNVTYPVPTRIQEGDLVVFGYKDDFLIRANLSGSAEGTLTLIANFLVCESVCLPVRCTASVALETTQAGPPDPQGSIFPQTLSSTDHSGRIHEGFIRLDLARIEQSRPLEFFPRTEGIVLLGTRPRFEVHDDTLRVELQLADTFAKEMPIEFSGILLFPRNKAYNITTTISENPESS